MHPENQDKKMSWGRVSSLSHATERKVSQGVKLSLDLQHGSQWCLEVDGSGNKPNCSEFKVKGRNTLAF